MSDYCTLADIKQDLPEGGISQTTDYDAGISQMITDASRMIDNEIGKWPNYFQPSTDDETRYYDGNTWEETSRLGLYGRRIQIDDCVSITSFSISEGGGVQSSDYTSWAQTDYYTEPYNNVALGIPIRWIEIDYLNGTKNSFYGYRKGVKVVGRFGWSSVAPSTISRATKIQVIRWFMRSKQAFADGGANPATGQMTYVKKLDADVAELIKPYILENLY